MFTNHIPIRHFMVDIGWAMCTLHGMRVAHVVREHAVVCSTRAMGEGHVQRQLTCVHRLRPIRMVHAWCPLSDVHKHRMIRQSTTNVSWPKSLVVVRYHFFEADRPCLCCQLSDNTDMSLPTRSTYAACCCLMSLAGSVSTFPFSLPMCIGNIWCMKARFDIWRAMYERNRRCCHATFDVTISMSADFGQGWKLISNVDLPFWEAHRRLEQTTLDVGSPLFSYKRKCDVGKKILMSTYRCVKTKGDSRIETSTMTKRCVQTMADAGSP